MKKLKKLKLNDSKIMSEGEMKKVLGGSGAGNEPCHLASVKDKRCEGYCTPTVTTDSSGKPVMIPRKCIYYPGVQEGSGYLSSFCACN